MEINKNGQLVSGRKESPRAQKLRAAWQRLKNGWRPAKADSEALRRADELLARDEEQNRRLAEVRKMKP